MNHNGYATEQERLLACRAMVDARSEPASDTMLPTEIPRCASMCNWMRNEREADEFLHGHERRCRTCKRIVTVEQWNRCTHPACPAFWQTLPVVNKR